jgi:hypothetical protein
MTDHVRRSLIAILALGAVTSLTLAFAPAAFWAQLSSLI